MSSTVQTDKERMQLQRAAKKAKKEKKRLDTRCSRDQLKLQHAQDDDEDDENEPPSIKMTNIYILFHSIYHPLTKYITHKSDSMEISDQDFQLSAALSQLLHDRAIQSYRGSDRGLNMHSTLPT